MQEHSDATSDDDRLRILAQLALNDLWTEGHLASRLYAYRVDDVEED